MLGWLVSFGSFPVADVPALVRCHFVDTEPRRLRSKSWKFKKKKDFPRLLTGFLRHSVALSQDFAELPLDSSQGPWTTLSRNSLPPRVFPGGTKSW